MKQIKNGPSTQFNIDQALGGGKRSLRTLPKSCLLGSTGARLWADFLWPQPGFSGAIDFIHKLNIPSLFPVECDAVTSYEPSNINWYPSYLSMEYATSRVELKEYKYITWEDCAVSCQTWTNTSGQAIVLRLIAEPVLFRCEPMGNGLNGSLSVPHYGFTLQAALRTSRPELFTGLTLQPGESAELITAVALGLLETDTQSELEQRLDSVLNPAQSGAALLAGQQQTYQRWFEHAPLFASSEPLLDTTWLYRWFVMRHTLANPRYGNLQHPLFYEGRSHKMSKRPLDPKGWEFSKMIPLTVPMHLLEARWYNDPVYSQGAMRSMKASQDEEGFYKCLFVNSTLHSYANFMGWAAYQDYLVHRDPELLKEMLPSLKEQIRGESTKLGSAADSLLIEYTHNRTGKEYQPSYWYFHDFPKDCKDPATFTPLKRVDRSVYHYLNCLGVARLCRAANDTEAEEFEKQADTIHQDILHKMWDGGTQFFYDLHHLTDEKAWVKNVVGFYPYWAQLTDAEHADGLLHALNEEEFGTPSPFPSVSADCPVYQPEGSWQGNYFKGRNGCVWDGPTWPYTNSIVLDAMALESKRNGHKWDRDFGHLFREYSLLHYRNRDLSAPYLVEHYSSQSGEPLSDEVDYNHSYYIDLVIKHIAGLNVEESRFVLDPIDIGLSHFRLEGIRAAGYELTITYNRGDDPNIDLVAGYRIYVDGQLALESDALTRMVYSFEKVTK
ncbi:MULTISPECIES: MGH1-like glycoside hydrolase domain-containing protein [unclassified Paenibacillus]|uniref:MGH1-like glycoside hydrolase domain-containing protein n=1 Tax=unclassified Paenibacillus TaxID=185978 RepID=UPI00363ABB73